MTEFSIKKTMLDNLRQEYNETLDYNKKRILRKQIYELEIVVAKLCLQHKNFILTPHWQDVEYINADDKYNCKICGCPITFK